MVACSIESYPIAISILFYFCIKVYLNAVNNIKLEFTSSISYRVMRFYVKGGLQYVHLSSLLRYYSQNNNIRAKALQRNNK